MLVLHMLLLFRDVQAWLATPGRSPRLALLAGPFGFAWMLAVLAVAAMHSLVMSPDAPVVQQAVTWLLASV